MKKIFAWMLTLLVLLGSVPLTAQTAQAGNAEPVDGELTVGRTTEVIVENKEETHYLRFTPQEDGVYVFESAAGEDTYGYLYDAEWEWITDDDDGGGNGEFRIIATLTGGETYYVGAMYYAHQKTGTIPVSARKEMWSLKIGLVTIGHPRQPIIIKLISSKLTGNLEKKTEIWVAPSVW